MGTLEDYKLLTTDPNWVNLKRFNNSLKEVLVRYPDGCPTHVIANGLMIDDDDVDELYSKIVLKLRDLMGVSPL